MNKVGASIPSFQFMFFLPIPIVSTREQCNNQIEIVSIYMFNYRIVTGFYVPKLLNGLTRNLFAKKPCTQCWQKTNIAIDPVMDKQQP